jgi:hypothetical protein
MKALKTIGISVGALFALLLVVGCSSPEQNSDSDAATPQVQTAEAASTPAPKPKSKRAQLSDDLRDIDAGGYAGQLKLISRDIDRKSTSVVIKTPEGGFEGASTKDLDGAAAAVFNTVYGKGGYPAKETVVVFRGGLVDTETGKDLPNVNTGIYTMTKTQADRIDWSDSDAVQFNINWANYRDFAHPALKG